MPSVVEQLRASRQRRDAASAAAAGGGASDADEEDVDALLRGDRPPADASAVVEVMRAARQRRDAANALGSRTGQRGGRPTAATRGMGVGAPRSRPEGRVHPLPIRRERHVGSVDGSDGSAYLSSDVVAPPQDLAHRRRPPVPRGTGREAAAAAAAVPRKRRRVATSPAAAGGGGSDDGGADDGPAPLSLSQASSGSAGGSDSVSLDIRPMAHGKRRAGAGAGAEGRSRSAKAAVAAGVARPPERMLQAMDMANLMAAFKEKFPPPKSHLASLGGTFAVRVCSSAGFCLRGWFLWFEGMAGAGRWAASGGSDPIAVRRPLFWLSHRQGATWTPSLVLSCARLLSVTADAARSPPPPPCVSLSPTSLLPLSLTLVVALLAILAAASRYSSLRLILCNVLDTFKLGEDGSSTAVAASNLWETQLKPASDRWYALCSAYCDDGRARFARIPAVASISLAMARRWMLAFAKKHPPGGDAGGSAAAAATGSRRRLTREEGGGGAAGGGSARAREAPVARPRPGAAAAGASKSSRPRPSGRAARPPQRRPRRFGDLSGSSSDEESGDQEGADAHTRRVQQGGIGLTSDSDGGGGGGSSGDDAHPEGGRGARQAAGRRDPSPIAEDAVSRPLPVPQRRH